MKIIEREEVCINSSWNEYKFLRKNFFRDHTEIESKNNRTQNGEKNIIKSKKTVKSSTPNKQHNEINKKQDLYKKTINPNITHLSSPHPKLDLITHRSTIALPIKNW